MSDLRWTEHQQAMLQAMGVRLWLPTPAPADEPAAMAPSQASSQAPPPSPAAARHASADAPAALPPSHVTAPVPTPAMVGAAQPPHGARPEGVAAMDWADLRAAVAGCRACALCESRNHTVFGVGHEQAHWMLVGEAPGENEDREGEPFVGKAGQLLDNMLRTVGLTRQDAPAPQQVYIANVLKCRPPANRNPEPQEVAQCEPFLKRQVELVSPRLILAMGRFAVQTLLGSHEPIGRLRGRVHQYHGVPVVVTYHPAYLLRNALDKSRAWDDLCLAREVYAGAGATN